MSRGERLFRADLRAAAALGLESRVVGERQLEGVGRPDAGSERCADLRLGSVRRPSLERCGDFRVYRDDGVGTHLRPGRVRIIQRADRVAMDALDAEARRREEPIGGVQAALAEHPGNIALDWNWS
jgi:hypothetical protein